MALAPGTFTPGAAGITSPGGAYTYDPGSLNPQFYAGEFFIDTGIDDPVGWDTGLEAAELYAARVYGASGTFNNSGGDPDGAYTGRWQLTATPVWSSKFFKNPTVETIGQRRIYILVRVWLMEPIHVGDTSWQRIDTVKWTLYRA